MPAKEKIILALDVSDPVDARGIVGRFRDHVGMFKIGLELFTASGPAFVEEITGAGIKVFLDLKFHDIPSTVIKASLNAARLGVYMFNLHASGGLEMMKRCKDAVVDLCLRQNLRQPRMIAVTVLTGLNQDALKAELGIQHSLRTHVKELSKLSRDAGLDGVVASGHEVAVIRDHFGKKFLIVTPGIRASWSPPDDQKRTMTPRQAIREGADYLVLGRTVLNQPDPLRSLELISAEILTA